MKLPLDGRYVLINVGVVKLEIIENERARSVVDKLCSLVKKSRVVFVRLNDKEGRATQARASLEVGRHATDQKSGCETRMLENPSKEGCGRRFAVRARNRQHPASLQYLAREPLRAGSLGDVALEERFDDRLAARHDVADDHDIGPRRQLGGFETLDELDAERCQLRAHRRIYVVVGTGDTMARRLREGCNPGHEGTGNAENVDVHRCL